MKRPASLQKAVLFEYGKGAGFCILHNGAIKLRYEKARLFAQAGFSEYGGGAGI
ncbi:hypothetical protein [Shewanella algae]|uniref:hypothetical protein n=1 Tax=Shewanella algae TaxID=38313 RepID=UPI001AAC7402|nr:hypothetical protein [Shewanella algae]MBO2578018.1 hypothetical protein [Shewanella algae]MBO2683526.1 hypothetical protein [Shewanella algae]